MHSKKQLFPGFIFALLISASAVADVTLPAIIDNQMVVQSGTHAPIWGWADAGEKVTVSFAGQTHNTKAAENGKWMVKLDPLTVSADPRTMTIKGRNEIQIEDVLVGEVWLASGQSNMEFSLGAIAAEEKEIAAAQNANKHLLKFCAGPKVSRDLP
jgi:sialate O-acetylesterase